MEAELRKAEESKVDISRLPEEFNFDFIELGVSGKVELVKNNAADKKLLPKTTLPLGLPPIFPELKHEIEDLLLTPEAIPIHGFQQAQKFWSAEKNIESLLDVTSLPCPTFIEMERNAKTGQLEGYHESYNSEVGLTAQNSMSLQRQPGAYTDSVKGESSNNPFWPGGMQLPPIDNFLTNTEEDTMTMSFDADILLSCPPGFSSDIIFDRKHEEQSGHGSVSVVESNKILNVAYILSADLDLTDLYVEVEQKVDSRDKESPVDVSYSLTEDIPEDVLKTDTMQKEDSRISTETSEEIWASIDNSDTNNFHRNVPDMAFKYPFELDVFQKRAIMHLEKHENVLVAAHTSAGKTVVAEYAIALAQNHMRRTIYTSPIKALSNQKFRDFKTTFPEVGLLTGDVQIKPESSCLIMTTEILRSMLYNGSDVIRDLEWVIFDEIHYINDADRGVVWEEVLIMLPSHVGIILLSATVPNTLEFASWIGKTKKKQVYVVQTKKRPVPLEHYLYTGNSNKTSKELFCILDRKGKFVVEGYRAALQAKKDRSSKSDLSHGPKGTRQGNPKQDRNIWLSVVQMLQKKEQLPVVAFTLSKRKCDTNADMIKTMDLLTTTERSHIITFFNRSISKLKGTDRSLPQVIWMEELLKHGIGVHHSGILPILKEIVEMLFQKSLLKILFATETFAMGVNMPARTVVFDSTRKFDGENYRELLSSEYIQMAGRAGRRGLDTTGMVIILCKGDVPETSDLHKMMLGLPTKLTSQFRLTYYMILNLLRVKQLTVQDMMKRSFAEYFLQKDAPENEKKLDELKAKMKLLKDPECPFCSIDLKDYYLNWAEILQLRKEIKTTIFSFPVTIKSLIPGRLVLITNNKHKNALAVILNVGDLDGSSSKLTSTNSKSTNPLEKIFVVLILCSQTYEEGKTFDSLKQDSTTDKIKDTAHARTQENDLFQNHSEQFLSKRIFEPVGKPGQTVEEVMAMDIADIINKTIKCDFEKVIENHKKRLIPRFRLDPPSQSTIKAGQDLYNLTQDFIQTGCPILHPIRDMNINDIEFVENYRNLQAAESRCSSYKCLECLNIQEHFSTVRGNMKMKEDVLQLELQLSDESLDLMQEYHQRIQVLKELNYIDMDKNLQHKGRVAFEINTHEVMITELLINNILTDLHPTEIVAILSCFVFEQKKVSPPTLTENLQRVVGQIKETAERVAITQKECGLDVTIESYLETLHFGLVEVVYEWARGMSFKETTDLTDVSEGNVVRCIQRLDETCRDVKKAAHVIGVQTLCDKMEEGMSLIRRDIVFAASLYTT